MAEYDHEPYSSKQASFDYEDHKDQEHQEEDQSEAPKSMWEELDKEIRKLLENLVSKLHLENLLHEKPDDLEDKTAVSSWLDKLINLVKGSKQEEDEEEDDDEAVNYTTRGFDVSENEAVAKLERFKVKNLATGGSDPPVNTGKK